MSQKALGLFDITSLVVGSIIGADIYVAASFGSGLLGPAALAAWVVAGFLAVLIALAFAQCAMVAPRVGGSYAYAREAFGNFPGFLVGWSLWLAEWTSLAVFPIAFTRYLAVFFPHLSFWGTIAIKVLFVLFLTVVNYIGTRAAGKVNDFLTLAKLGPLLLFSLLGIAYLAWNPHIAAKNFTPFAPLGWTGFGPALVAIFWAYAGFELAAIPAGEVKDPRRTIPVAIIRGIGVVIIFYLVTNFVILGTLSWKSLARASAPLTDAFRSMALAAAPALSGAAATIMALGAVISISGSDESGTFGTSRLAYAMAVDGHLPRIFGRLHPRYGTPYVSLLFQNTTALIAAVLGNIGGLIKIAVFCLGLAYLVTALAALRLRRRHPDARLRVPFTRWIPYLAAAASLFLITQVSRKELLLGAGLVLLGVPLYLFFSPREKIEELHKQMLSENFRLERLSRYSERFLAHALKHLLARNPLK